MAEKTPTNPADGSAPGAGGAGLSSKTGRKMPLMPIILAVVVVGVGGGAGMVVGRMAQGGGDKGGASERVGPQEKVSYFDLEPIIVNLDEPRLARYVRVSVTLVASSDNAKAVTEALERNQVIVASADSPRQALDGLIANFVDGLLSNRWLSAVI
jgi:flagellar basal body-associated protein FliL